MATPISGTNQKFGVFTAVYAIEFVDWHSLLVIRQEFDEPQNHVIERDKNTATEETDESKAYHFFDT